MNKQTLESLLKQAESLIQSLLRSKGDLSDGVFDEKTAWMFTLSFILEQLKYEIDKFQQLYE